MKTRFNTVRFLEFVGQTFEGKGVWKCLSTVTSLEYGLVKWYPLSERWVFEAIGFNALDSERLCDIASFLDGLKGTR